LAVDLNDAGCQDEQEDERLQFETKETHDAKLLVAFIAGVFRNGNSSERSKS
jgi:hypothetical protein